MQTNKVIMSARGVLAAGITATLGGMAFQLVAEGSMVRRRTHYLGPAISPETKHAYLDRAEAKRVRKNAKRLAGAQLGGYYHG